MMDSTKQCPKVLVLTRNAWNNNNCTGSTLSNFFSDWPQDRITNVYCRFEKIANGVCSKYYRISEQDIIRGIINKGYCPGEEFEYSGTLASSPENVNDISRSKKVYSFFGNHRLTIALWLRDLLWAMGRWKNQKFDSFLESYHPDVVYMPCYDSLYMHRVLWYVEKKTKAKIVLFTGDDTYTLKQFNFSPLYWINRFVDRATMRKSVKMADTLFVISDKQKEEYDKIFKRDCVLLRKGGDFSKGFSPKSYVSEPIKLVYAGNIHSGRWETLAELVSAIKQINQTKTKIHLDIYTLSPRTDVIVSKLDVEGCSKLMPPASDQEIENALVSADALVFVEPFKLKEKLKWRLSFSTKIVDYLASSRAIIAIGPEGPASMEYLRKNNAALCINTVEEIEPCIKKIVDSPEILANYAKKAWDCGSKNNDIDETKKILRNELLCKTNG